MEVLWEYRAVSAYFGRASEGGMKLGLCVSVVCFSTALLLSKFTTFLVAINAISLRQATKLLTG